MLGLLPLLLQLLLLWRRWRLVLHGRWTPRRVGLCLPGRQRCHSRQGPRGCRQACKGCLRYEAHPHFTSMRLWMAKARCYATYSSRFIADEPKIGFAAKRTTSTCA